MAAGTEVERLIVRLIGDATSYQKMLKDASKSSKRTATEVEKAGRRMERLQARLIAVGGAMRSAGRSMQAFGRSLALRVTAPLAVIGGLGVKAFADFDQAMTESTSIMEVTGDQVERMKRLALELSTKGPQGPAELAKAYFFLASAGKDAEQAMALLPKVNQFATAGAFDLSTATDLLTDAQSALGMSSNDAARDAANLAAISDKLVRSNTLANASVQQFAEALTSDAATASRAVNAELDTTLAILALYADKGKKAAEAGNLFGRATRLLTKAARDNAKEFEKRNIRVVDKASGEYRNFIDIIDDMNKAFAGLTKPEIGKALSDLGFEALAQKSILPLLGATDQLKFYEKELKKAGGTTQAVADKQMQSFTNQMKLLRNGINAVGISIGEILAPMIVRLNGGIERGLKLWKNLSPAIKRTAVVVALVAAAVGPLLVLFGGIVSLVGFFITSVGTMLGVLGPVVAFFTGSWIPVLGATAIALGIALFRMEEMGDTVRWFGSLWGDLVAQIQPAIDGIKNAFAGGDLQLAFEIAWLQIQVIFQEAITKLRKQWADYILFMRDTWTEGTSFLQDAGREFFLNLEALGAFVSLKAGAVNERQFGMLMADIATRSEEGFVEVNASRLKALRDANKQAVKDRMGLNNTLIGLQARLDQANATAADKAAKARADRVARDLPDLAFPDLTAGIENSINSVKPKPINLTFITGRNAVKLGSAEAEKRLAEFRAATGGGAGPGKQGAGAGRSVFSGGPRSGRAAPDPAFATFGSDDADIRRADAVGVLTRMADGIDLLGILAEGEAEKTDATGPGFLDL